MTEEILCVSIKRDYEKREWVITEETAAFYRVLGVYSSLAQARRDLPFIRKNPRYAHLDKDGFAPGLFDDAKE